MNMLDADDKMLWLLQELYWQSRFVSTSFKMASCSTRLARFLHASVDMGTQMACPGAYTSRVTIPNRTAWDVQSRDKAREFSVHTCAFHSQPSERIGSAHTVTVNLTSSPSIARAQLNTFRSRWLAPAELVHSHP